MGNTDLTGERDGDRQDASEIEEAQLDGFGIDRSSRGEEAEGGISAREETRARGAHEKFETLGVEMLSGMQERTIFIRESGESLRRGSVRRGSRASNTRERSPHEFRHAARCAERRR